ncbi:hypothetical protein BT63DRAFT_422605 [Microthyrium microscopicum]|uniref:HCP-like protein n=1 Tax=Microthyrium microscopicum TaxID=703497 RepID=A0A6A6UIR1_9PEZI|nr:hypothetical protein BT63DRAFT_422605 [Microthyrium microscopicum]
MDMYMPGTSGQVLQALTLCSQSLQQIQHLEREYQSPPATLESLHTEAKHVARSLSMLNGLFYDPEKNLATTLETNTELRSVFDNCMNPCRIIFTSLGQELRKLFLPSYVKEAEDDDVKGRAKYLFTENVFKNYLSLGRTLRSAMQMLVSALQIPGAGQNMGLLLMIEPMLEDLGERCNALAGAMSPVDSKTENFSMGGSQPSVAMSKESMAPKLHAYHQTSPRMPQNLPQTPLSPSSGELQSLQSRNMPTSPDGDFKPLPPPALDSPPLPAKSPLRTSDLDPYERVTQYASVPSNRNPSSGPTSPVSQTQLPSQPRVNPFSTRTPLQTQGLQVPAIPDMRPGSTASVVSENEKAIEGLLTAPWPGRSGEDCLPEEPVLPLNFRKTTESPRPYPIGVAAPYTLPSQSPRTHNGEHPAPRFPPRSGSLQRLQPQHQQQQPILSQRSISNRDSSATTLAASSRPASHASSATEYSHTTSTSMRSRPNTNSFKGVSLFPAPSSPAPSMPLPLHPIRRTNTLERERQAEFAPEVVVAPPVPPIPNSPPQLPAIPGIPQQFHSYQVSPASQPSLPASPVSQTAMPHYTPISDVTNSHGNGHQRSASLVTASSQALPASVRADSTFNDTASIVSSLNGTATIASSDLTLIDFEILIPKISSGHATVPVRPDELESRLVREKPAVMSTQDVSQHLDWAEDILRLASNVSKFNKRLRKVGYKSAKPMINTETILDARNIIERHVQVGHARALFLKARWFELDEDATQELYLSALSKGYLRAAYHLGRKYEVRRENATAFEYYRKGGYGQDSPCGYRLAKAFLKGELDKKKDHKAAIPLLQQAVTRADKDGPLAPYLLGMLYTKSYQKSISLNKKLLPPNEMSARSYIQQAASLGLAAAQLHLALAYSKSDNDMAFSVDHSLALHYHFVACVQGEAESALELSNCFWWGQQGLWAANEQLAFAFAKMAANDGLVSAFCQLGFFLERGIGTQINLAEAKAFYLKGASAGDRMAANRLDALRRSGRQLGFSKQ